MKTTHTLSGLTLNTVENYRVAAIQGLAAYRAGSHRVLNAIDSAFERILVVPVAKLTAAGADRLNDARSTMNSLAVKGIDSMADRTSQVIEMSLDTTATQLNKVADLAAGIENTIIANTLQTVSRLSLPGAKVAQAVSGKVADGARALAGRVAGNPVDRKIAAVRKSVKTAVQAVAQPAARRAARVAKPVLAAKPRKSMKAASVAKAVQPRRAGKQAVRTSAKQTSAAA